MTEKDEFIKFQLKQEITEENLRSFILGYEEHTLERFLKSEEAPEKNDQNIKILVGENFRSLVLDSEEHFLVEFYGPKCLKCLQVDPVFEDLASRFQKEQNQNILIGKFDDSKNDVKICYF